VLQSLAYSNYYSPRPQPIDPAVFFDLVKIRVLIEDATSLAVRAANGTTSASLHNSLNAGNGMLNGSDAEILGIGSNRGGNAKLSPERKHRMREHATQKLAHAYQLDEIAASVATMQSASALEDVAKFVLQRSKDDPDAKYVHFFHEKIPSRAMVEYTPLDSLSDVIRSKPTDGAPWRTRAVTRLFKEDFTGATRDLTEGLAIHRLYHSQSQNHERDLILARDAAKMAREYRADSKVAEKDQPSGLEPQMLFHRGGAYLTLACDKIEEAFLENPGNKTGANSMDPPREAIDTPPDLSSDTLEKLRADARKLVRTYAKRALRDYVAFLSHYDYTPGLPAEFTHAFLQRVTEMQSNGYNNRSRSEKLLDVDAHSANGTHDTLVKYEGYSNGAYGKDLPPIPKPKVHRLNALFAAVPPADLPAYPPDLDHAKAKTHPIFSLPDFSEAVTYHPFLTDVLHSVLLCHCLIQTSPKEHLRHARMAARIVRVCDGYPIFLAARSPARADWVEVLRRTQNWLGLETAWDRLCTPTSVQSKQKDAKPETEEQRRERVKRDAIRDALADDRVFDEESFRASVRARELRAAREEEEEQRKEYLRTSSSSNGEAKDESPKQPTLDDPRAYPITTERADAIARWIRNAPPPGIDGSSRPKKTGRKGRLTKEASDLSNSTLDLGRSVESLDIVD
jgi:hypothetical protein